MIENPRQTSAYFYPPKFAPTARPFHELAYERFRRDQPVRVGSASIVGCETLHSGDVSRKRENLDHIDACSTSDRIVGSAHYSLDDLKFKVYVRRVFGLCSHDARAVGCTRLIDHHRLTCSPMYAARICGGDRGNRRLQVLEQRPRRGNLAR